MELFYFVGGRIKHHIYSKLLLSCCTIAVLFLAKVTNQRIY